MQQMFSPRVQMQLFQLLSVPAHILSGESALVFKLGRFTIDIW
jgi:hypothetical protein